MPELMTRRAYLLAAIRTAGQPVTTARAEQLMADSPWPTTRRNTARKDLRSFARAGLLTPAVGADGRTTYLLTTSTGNR
ncbi:hypothetical protein ACFCYB_00480 [Streptomyces sp. NPDC056309]|uniref:hypothetical protein n=1 Tax=Streptomyces sp. NPDC056309 TaxID=3345781 RepID=UPI0035DDA513